MSWIPPQKVDEIYQVADIVEVISDYVSLKKRGQNYWALSPFTQEKTPSFAVNPGKNIYKCFSTGKGGNAVSFLMEMEGYSYPEALRHLARKYHIEIEEEESSAEQQAVKDHKQSLFIVNEFAAAFYHRQLIETEKGKKIGLAYFKERGLLEATIKTFLLGYAPDAWSGLVDEASQKQYKEEFLLELGLVGRSDKTGNLYDRFRDRVMFPIANPVGKIVGFGGRILSARKDVGKYINSSESEIYNKSKVLYGLYQAKQAIRSEELCILTEGYMDTLMLHQHGIKHVVASSGTALTLDQIRLIRRFTTNVLMIYDGDKAGIKAALRGIDLLVKENMSAQVLILPDQHDPDSYVRSHGAQHFLDYAQRAALTFIDFKIKVLSEDSGGDPVAQTHLIKELAQTLAFVPDRVQRQMYIKQVAQQVDITEALMTHAVDEAEQIQQKEEARALRRERHLLDRSPDQNATVKPLNTFETLELAHQEKELLRIMLNYYEYDFVEDLNGPLEDEQGNPIEREEIPMMEFFIVELESLTFENQIFERLKNEVFDLYDQSERLNIHHYLNHEDQAIGALVAELLTIPHEISPNWRKHGAFVLDHDADLTLTVKSAMYIYKYKKVQKLLKDARSKLQELGSAEREEDEEEIEKTLAVYQHLLHIHTSLSKKIGAEGAILGSDGDL